MDANMSRILEEMKANIEKMENMLTTHRERINLMSAEAVDSNPYSRLMALQRMRVVKGYERIRGKTVAIVGVGGVGSVTAEMLTRCGIGKLILFDGDKVEMADMNRMFFKPNQVGLSKVWAAASTLAFINPDVRIETHNYTISKRKNFDRFLATITKCGTVEGRPVDLVLSCVGHDEVRMAINAACNERNLNWFESSVSVDGVSAHIRFIRPGDTACLVCARCACDPKDFNKSILMWKGVCAASLPTTVAITAGCLAQNVLKYLLNFGQVVDFLGYCALIDFFPDFTYKANPQCEDRNCLLRQKEFQARPKMEDTSSSSYSESSQVMEVGQGLELPYELPEYSSDDVDEVELFIELPEGSSDDEGYAPAPSGSIDLAELTEDALSSSPEPAQVMEVGLGLELLFKLPEESSDDEETPWAPNSHSSSHSEPPSSYSEPAQVMEEGLGLELLFELPEGSSDDEGYAPAPSADEISLENLIGSIELAELTEDALSSSPEPAQVMEVGLGLELLYKLPEESSDDEGTPWAPNSHSSSHSEPPSSYSEPAQVLEVGQGLELLYKLPEESSNDAGDAAAPSADEVSLGDLMGSIELVELTEDASPSSDSEPAQVMEVGQGLELPYEAPEQSSDDEEAAPAPPADKISLQIKEEVAADEPLHAIELVAEDAPPSSGFEPAQVMEVGQGLELPYEAPEYSSDDAGDGPAPPAGDRNCLLKQMEFQARLKHVQTKEEVVGDDPLHAIELVAENAPPSSSPEPAQVLEVGQGLELPYEDPEYSSDDEGAPWAPSSHSSSHSEPAQVLEVGQGLELPYEAPEYSSDDAGDAPAPPAGDRNRLLKQMEFQALLKPVQIKEEVAGDDPLHAIELVAEPPQVMEVGQGLELPYEATEYSSDDEGDPWAPSSHSELPSSHSEPAQVLEVGQGLELSFEAPEQSRDDAGDAPASPTGDRNCLFRQKEFQARLLHALELVAENAPPSSDSEPAQVMEVGQGLELPYEAPEYSSDDEGAPWAPSSHSSSHSEPAQVLEVGQGLELPYEAPEYSSDDAGDGPAPPAGDRNCLLKQMEFQARLKHVQIKEEVVGDDPLHAIELVAENAPPSSSPEPAQVLEVGQGLELPYEDAEYSSDDEGAPWAPSSHSSSHSEPAQVLEVGQGLELPYEAPEYSSDNAGDGPAPPAGDRNCLLKQMEFQARFKHVQIKEEVVGDDPHDDAIELVAEDAPASSSPEPAQVMEVEARLKPVQIKEEGAGDDPLHAIELVAEPPQVMEVGQGLELPYEATEYSSDDEGDEAAPPADEISLSDLMAKLVIDSD